METYQILCLIGIPTLSTLIVTTVFNHVVNSSKKAKAQRRQERKADLKELFDEFILPLDEKVNKMTEDLQSVASGTLASLRNDLLDCYYSCKAKGYRNTDDTKTFNNMFEAYTNLGGNDIIEEDVSPSFHLLPLYTLEEEVAIRHQTMRKQEELEKKLQEVIERSSTCIRYKKEEKGDD